MRILLLLMALVAVGCSSTEPESTTPVALPAEVVATWLDAVAAGDVPDELVEPVGFATLAGVENQVRSDEMAALLDGGLTEELSSGYWRSFRDDFLAIRGIAVDSLDVGEERPEDVGPGFAAVIVTNADTDTDSVAILRLSDEHGWQIDMVGTLGPALAASLGDYLQSALGGAHAEVIAGAYEYAVLPALDAAIVLDPTNSELVFGAEAIRQALLDRESSTG